MRIATASAILGLLILSASVFSAYAAQKGTKDAGEVACINWCFDHNTSTPGRDRCLNQCECYYHGNLCGRGATGRNAAPLNASPRPPALKP